MSHVYMHPTVRALQQLHADSLQLDRRRTTIVHCLDLQAKALLSGHSQGNPCVSFHLACWCPRFLGKSVNDILATPLTLELARQTIASEYGYASWEDVVRLQQTRFDAEFEQAVDSMLAGRLDELSSALDAHPGMVHQSSQHPHGAGLLHYLAANGVESCRQVTPLNAADIAHHLIDAGINVNAVATMYGGGSTALGLWLSSAHPAQAGVQKEVAEVLRRAGAIEQLSRDQSEAGSSTTPAP